MSNPLASHTDNQLAAKAAQGHRDAFEELYERHCEGVAKALASFTRGNQDTLDDLSQEVFIRVIRGLDRYEQKRPFTPWLYTIALNVGRSFIRSQSGVEPMDPAKLEQIPIAGDEPKGWSEELLGAAAMMAVASLPSRLREVVTLRISTQMTYADIAETMSIPEGTARRRMFQALDIIRQKLGLKADLTETCNG